MKTLKDKIAIMIHYLNGGAIEVVKLTSRELEGPGQFGWELWDKGIWGDPKWNWAHFDFREARPRQGTYYLGVSNV